MEWNLFTLLFPRGGDCCNRDIEWISNFKLLLDVVDKVGDYKMVAERLLNVIKLLLLLKSSGYVYTRIYLSLYLHSIKKIVNKIFCKTYTNVITSRSFDFHKLKYK